MYQKGGKKRHDRYNGNAYIAPCMAFFIGAAVFIFCFARHLAPPLPENFGLSIIAQAGKFFNWEKLDCENFSKKTSSG